jgi:phosphoribosyl-ATP pyrophosphohydrolase
MAAPMESQPDILIRLEAVIARRMHASPDESYVALMHSHGAAHIARKLGEESTEAVVAALTGTPEELVNEAADVLFHLLVLLAEKGVPVEDVLAELERREGISGLAEKAARSE